MSSAEKCRRGLEVSTPVGSWRANQDEEVVGGRNLCPSHGIGCAEVEPFPTLRLRRHTLPWAFGL